MRSIVVLIDHRPDASARARTAVELAQRERARLTMLAAIPAVPAFAWTPPFPPPESPRALKRACERGCEELLRRHAAAVPEAVPVTMSARRGRPHAALLDEIRERDHDVVVLAPPRPGLLGALARARRRRLLRRCPARVVTAPGSGDPQRPSAPPSGSTARGMGPAPPLRSPLPSSRRRARA